MLIIGAACSGTAGRPDADDTILAPRAAVSAADRPFLVDPLDGYPLVVAGARAVEVREAHADLLRGRSLEARRAADLLLAADPGFHPARVLVAQTQLAEGDPTAAAVTLAPVLDELPEYTAARLLAGRTAERLDDVVGAYRAYRPLADAVESARQRSELLAERALDIVYRRTVDALERGRLDLADELAAELESWAPDDPRSLAAGAEVAAARGDGERELAVVRRLTELVPDDRDWLERQAGLEVRVGNARAGMQILRDLNERYPGDPELAERLEAAEFRWRFSLQPQEIRDRAARPELTRADAATMLYWLVPGVRYARPASARIAADILDHPDREAITRVVNLRLMTVEESVHRFHPERPAQRAEVLSALLRVLERQEPRPACVGSGLSERPAWSTVCELAERCALIESRADCLPEARAGGEPTLEAIRRAQRLMLGGATR